MRISFLIFLLLLPTLVFAEENIVVEQLVNINFEPKKSAILVNNQEISATSVNLEDREYILIALVSEEILNKDNNYYSFVLNDDQGNFFATKYSKLNSLNKVSVFEQSIAQKNKILENRLSSFKNDRDKLKEEYSAREKDFAENINLKDILKLKAKLDYLNNSINTSNDTLTELKVLIENRDSNAEPKDLAANSRILSQHLSDAAKVTAAAERLSRKKKETALTSFKQKLKTIEEMQQVDLAAMAKQLIELRKIRSKLENTADTSNQF